MNLLKTGRGRGLTLGICLLAGLGGLPASGGTPRVAAQDRAPVTRTVEGKVKDKGGAPIKGAVVYLQDVRSSALKSAIAEDDGSYRFVQLSLNTDYNLWAQIDGRKSKSRSISSFDSKPNLFLDLVIDK